MTRFRAYLRKAIPDSVLALRRRHRERKLRNQFLHCDGAKDIFTKVYESQRWGGPGSRGQGYYSGSGSHNPQIIDPYVSAVSNFLLSLRERPDVVDLGCGDFTVGSRVRAYCGRYIACDVVDGLVSQNKSRYAKNDVEFRVVDIVHDELPDGSVVFIRQVLQHLCNDDIQRVVVKLAAKYHMVVLTEHLPLSNKFVANLDKPTGPDVRIEVGELGSGVILTEPPFNLRVKEDTVLCEVFESIGARMGVIRTNLYAL